MGYEAIDANTESIAKVIVNAAYNVHKALGPGLLEKVYETCVCNELRKAGLTVVRQQSVPIQYDGILFEEGLRLDLLVEEKVIVEIKAVDILNAAWKAQLLSQMKMTGKRLGLLINFDVPLIKEGITRMVL